MSELRFKCQTCQRQLVTKSNRAGQLHRCPSCQSFVQVPAPAPPSAEEPATRQVPPAPEPAPVPVKSPTAQPPTSAPPPPPRLLTWPLVFTACTGLFFGGLAGASIAPLQSQKTFADHQLRRLLQDPRQYGLEPLGNPDLRWEAKAALYAQAIDNLKSLVHETADALEAHQPSSPEELEQFCADHHARLIKAVAALERPPGYEIDYQGSAKALGVLLGVATAHGCLELHSLHPVGNSDQPGSSFARAEWHQQKQPKFAKAIRLAADQTVSPDGK